MKDKVVILVDDGVATGSTMLVAVKFVRSQKPRKVVVAIPVGPPDAVEALKQATDEVICLLAPHHFAAVGEFYEEFAQVSDDEASAYLRKTGFAKR